MKILNLKNISVIKTITTVLAVMMIAPGAKAVPPTGQPSAQGMDYFTRICGQSLIRAARRGSTEDVEFSVKNGPTGSVQRAEALCIAVENNYYEIVKFLLPWCKNNPESIETTLRVAAQKDVYVYNIVKSLLSPSEDVAINSLLIMPEM